MPAIAARMLSQQKVATHAFGGGWACGSGKDGTFEKGAGEDGEVLAVLVHIFSFFGR